MTDTLTPKAIEVLLLMQKRHPCPLIRQRKFGRSMAYQGWFFAGDPEPDPNRAQEGTVVQGRTLNILVSDELVVVFGRRRAILTEAGLAWQKENDG